MTTRGKLFLEAKKELAIQKEADPKGKKAKTLKGKAQEIRCHEGTGWIATSDWLNHHVKVENGKPCPQSDKKGKLWVVTVHIRCLSSCMEGSLSPAEGKPFRPIRCFGLQSGETSGKITSIVSGDDHLLTEGLEQETHPC